MRWAASAAAGLARSPPSSPIPRRTRLDLVASFQEWESYVIDGLRAMQASGDLNAEADPDALGVAVIAAVQGGLLLTNTTRDTRPLELALDIPLAFVALDCATTRD